MLRGCRQGARGKGGWLLQKLQRMQKAEYEMRSGTEQRRSKRGGEGGGEKKLQQKIVFNYRCQLK